MKGLNRDVIDDVGMFFNKVNDRALFKLGIVDSYDDGGDAALGETVEYFHPQITLDDRMRYIAENIVYSDLDSQSKVVNTILSHFYGARGIHQIIMRDENPKTALIDVHKYMNDNSYAEELHFNLEEAVAYGLPLYGTTELRTSIFGAANAHSTIDGIKNTHPANILKWVAGFVKRGIVDKMLAANSLEELYNILIQIEGIGSYYGYHCSTSNSVNPEINANHDENFCMPGPGARYTLGLLFEQSRMNISMGEQVVWFRNNYENYIGKFPLHESTHNILVNGKKVFRDEQDTLKVYGSEVGLCQYGVYERLKANPHLINRRKVSRLDPGASHKYFNRLPMSDQLGLFD